MTETALLSLRGVTKTFRSRRSPFARPTLTRAAVDVDLDVHRGETVALVGESGSGKTTVARIALRLHDPDSGTVRFEGQDITRLGERRLRPLRRRMAMVFQDPYSSLNPRHTVGVILARVLRNHGMPRDRATLEGLLTQVGLGADMLDRYPHEFSGGQRQRIGIARALAGRPSLLVADEPVSALDVSVRAQVLNLLTDLRDEHDLGLLVVAHDLAVVRAVADRVAVMYLGHIVEEAPAELLYRDPRHPYTQALLAAVPRPDPGRPRPAVVRGEIGGPPERGCPFAPRCPRADDRCRTDMPPLEHLGGGHRVACHHPGPDD
ncbi:ABC transporter ATP-binding protein [Mobilicoccus pelagius]|uniref:Putative peptide ABC transporter ATP-binding protein n=1 Tax=Mobilicoccus pelagius NBRC 104925 TaxID=1089455 RepID=H5URF7_9MICO|nr:ABC transporter ATP-binding protein [Mobilicoccus pelagius]GAB48315.1 putative peptide ABC transporter ATP-binding protein [Mobilicoccus pelagius NBRC 104925]